MGAQLSKTAGKAETAAEKPGEAAASPTKTNGQVNAVLTSISRECGRAGGGCAPRAQPVRNCGQTDRDPRWESHLHGTSRFSF